MRLVSCQLQTFKFNATIHQQYSITRLFLAAQSRLNILEFYSLQYLSVDGGGGMPDVEEGGGRLFGGTFCVPVFAFEAAMNVFPSGV